MWTYNKTDNTLYYQSKPIDIMLFAVKGEAVLEQTDKFCILTFSESDETCEACEDMPGDSNICQVCRDSRRCRVYTERGIIASLYPNQYYTTFVAKIVDDEHFLFNKYHGVLSLYKVTIPEGFEADAKTAPVKVLDSVVTEKESDGRESESQNQYMDPLYIKHVSDDKWDDKIIDSVEVFRKKIIIVHGWYWTPVHFKSVYDLEIFKTQPSGYQSVFMNEESDMDENGLRIPYKGKKLFFSYEEYIKYEKLIRIATQGATSVYRFNTSDNLLYAILLNNGLLSSYKPDNLLGTEPGAIARYNKLVPEKLNDVKVEIQSADEIRAAFGRVGSNGRELEAIDCIGNISQVRFPHNVHLFLLLGFHDDMMTWSQRHVIPEKECRDSLTGLITMMVAERLGGLSISGIDMSVIFRFSDKNIMDDSKPIEERLKDSSEPDEQVIMRFSMPFKEHVDFEKELETRFKGWPKSHFMAPDGKAYKWDESCKLNITVSYHKGPMAYLPNF